MTRLMAPVLGALSVSLIGCSTMQNTPQQDYVYEMGRICEAGATSTKLERVAPDGRYWMRSAGLSRRQPPRRPAPPARLMIRTHGASVESPKGPSS
jgi:hypothetical protein